MGNWCEPTAPRQWWGRRVLDRIYGMIFERRNNLFVIFILAFYNIYMTIELCIQVNVIGVKMRKLRSVGVLALRKQTEVNLRKPALLIAAR